MTKLDLGRVGAVIDPGDAGRPADAAVALEAAGYGTIWVTGGPLQALDQLVEVVRATSTARVASGILSVDRFPADDVAALYADLESSHPGRFVLGLGGAHGARPFATLSAYLDRLDAAGVPASRRIMGALGPRMIELAAERAAGAFPVLVTPEYTVDARARLGADPTLAVEQLVALAGDASQARELALQPLGFLATLPQYQASFRRQGFTDGEIAGRANRLVDALVPGGTAARAAHAVTAQLEAGADHVAVSVVSERPAADSLDEWRELAAALGLRSAAG
jgi:probable F420-dependent oxidoreductase